MFIFDWKISATSGAIAYILMTPETGSNLVAAMFILISILSQNMIFVASGETSTISLAFFVNFIFSC